MVPKTLYLVYLIDILEALGGKKYKIGLGANPRPFYFDIKILYINHSISIYLIKWKKGEI